MRHRKNALSHNIRARSVELLDRHLAASIDLHALAMPAHWNVSRPTFIAIHNLFGQVAEGVENDADAFAERAGPPRGTARGVVQLAVRQSFLMPYPLTSPPRKSVFLQSVRPPPPSAGRLAARSMRQPVTAIPIPQTYSPRCREASMRALACRVSFGTRIAKTAVGPTDAPYVRHLLQGKTL
jgi:Ferritin-like domain